MTKIYEQAKDVHVKSSVIYAKDNMAYKDVTCSIPYTTSELKEAFLKGAVIDIPAGYYDNESRLLLNPSSLSQGGVSAVNFAVPQFGKNKYPITINEDNDALTFIADSNVYRDPNEADGDIQITGNNPNHEPIIMEFGPGTELYSAITKLGSAQKTISFVCDYQYGTSQSLNITLSCGVDSVTETLSVMETRRLSLTTTGDLFVFEIYGFDTESVVISEFQVELGSEATEYEEYQKYGTEIVGIAESIPDPT